jgi:hypothetical protein
VDIRGICGHFMDICGHLRIYLNFAACPDKMACPQRFLSFVLSEDMPRTCPGQMKLSWDMWDYCKRQYVVCVADIGMWQEAC